MPDMPKPNKWGLERRRPHTDETPKIKGTGREKRKVDTEFSIIPLIWCRIGVKNTDFSA